MASLNTAFHTGDSEDNVLENRRRIFALFGYDSREIVSSIQVHGTGLAIFSQVHRGEGALPGSAREQCDALVTTAEGLTLTAYAADCMLIYFVSQQKALVALAHAGWRGTLGGIGSKVVRCLHELYSLAPDRLLVGFSPAVCRNCYRVNGKVAEQFQYAGWDGPAYLKQIAEEHWSLDLAAINAEQLIQTGVKEVNMARSNWCTSCNPELFYSYRRDQGITGRMIGFIALKPFGRHNYETEAEKTA